jgi:class 3 adenylate cyclase
MSKRQFRVPFRIAIAGAIISIVAIMSLLTFLIIYYRGEADAKPNARLLFTENSMEVREQLDKRLSALIRLASLGSAVPGLETRPSGFGLDHPSIGFLFSIMDAEPSIYGAYAGWSDGDFLMLINTAGESHILEANQAPADCRFIVRAISGQGSGRTQRWSYLDASRRLLSQRTEQQPSFDPRSRDWYGIAAGDERPHLGKAYVFNSLNAPGITASHAFSKGVFGVDMTLADIKSFLNETSPSKEWGILLLEDGSRLLAASDRAAAWLPADVPVLGDVGGLPVVTADQAWKDAGGKVWLRQRSDWEWGTDTRLSLVVMAPLAEFMNFVDSMRSTLILLALMVLLVALPIALWVSSHLSRPLSTIARDAEKVSNMDFSGQLAYESRIVEIDHLSSAYSRMKYALNANRMLIEAQRDSYARFVPERMLELFDKSRITDVGPRNCKVLELTVMFSDIRSYTAISESLSCSDVFELLNSYFEMTNPIIKSNGGIIDKYIGDAIMSLFPSSPDGALRSAISINRALSEFNADRRIRDEAEILTGTGIHFGTVELGTVGDSTRLQATVIGDAVNVSSRLESATKMFGVRMLMSETAHERLKDPGEFHLRQIDTVRVKGKEQTIGLYEVFDLDEPSVMVKKMKIGSIFADALQGYMAGEFPKALDLFAYCAAECPEDTVVSAYMKRCATLIRIPPGKDWAGVSTL